MSTAPGIGPIMVLTVRSSASGSCQAASGDGGAVCTIFPLGPSGPPAYSTYEENFVGGHASVTGLRTCWFGFIRNTVVHDVTLRNNRLGDPDGNEIVTNIVGGNLRCTGNDPHAQLGDSGGTPNIVAGHASGECRPLAA